MLHSFSHGDSSAPVPTMPLDLRPLDGRALPGVDGPIIPTVSLSRLPSTGFGTQMSTFLVHCVPSLSQGGATAAPRECDIRPALGIGSPRASEWSIRGFGHNGVCNLQCAVLAQTRPPDSSWQLLKTLPCASGEHAAFDLQHRRHTCNSSMSAYADVLS
ncbi:hypothetical protein EJ02DRAFT_16272 [Clathrospora elynae]|uniref:Uncharacterized protein n=1 Tax=Clathrospora elynae TaxID=706981 RepID=A0A6A5SGC5_9PLEO|nr:hypothetical protein EJ02DRAFT_16272 [Clathrospora elynae]